MRVVLKKVVSQIDFIVFFICNMIEEDFVILVIEEEIIIGIKGQDIDFNYMFLFFWFLKGLEEVDLNNNGFVKCFMDVDECGCKFQIVNEDDVKFLLDKFKDYC